MTAVASLPTLKADLYYVIESDLNYPELFSILSEDEVSRANSFKFDKDRRLFVCARGVLRSLISEKIGEPADRIQFDYTAYGKPFLPQEDLYFNVSHSNQMILIGISESHEVGVDLEFVREFEEMSNVAKRFFSESEYQELDQLKNKKDYLKGFYNCWTRKEAFIKAIGEGLSFPLDQFSVSLEPGSKPELVETYYDDADKFRWSCFSFYKGQYIGACFVPQKPASFNLIEYK